MAALHRSEVEGLLTKAALRASALQEAQRAVLRTAEETKVIPRTSPGAYCTATQRNAKHAQPQNLACARSYHVHPPALTRLNMHRRFLSFFFI